MFFYTSPRARRSAVAIQYEKPVGCRCSLLQDNIALIFILTVKASILSLTIVFSLEKPLFSDSDGAATYNNANLPIFIQQL